jgi:hypothetical protein
MDKASLSGQALAEMPKYPRFQPNPVRGDAKRVVEVLAYPSVQLLDVTGAPTITSRKPEERRLTSCAWWRKADRA